MLQERGHGAVGNLVTTLVIDDKAYGRLIHGESSSDGRIRFAQSMQASNFGNIQIAELDVHVRLTSRPVAPTSLLHIMLILGMSLGDKMMGIAAKAIIAFMSYLFAVWDRAIVQFIGDTMRAESFAILATAAHFAVTVLGGCALPKPAFVKWAGGDIFPKASRKCVRGIIEGHHNLQLWCQSRGRFERRSAISIGFLQFIIAQVGDKGDLPSPKGRLT